MNRRTRKALKLRQAVLIATRPSEPKDDPTASVGPYFAHPDGGRHHVCYFIPGTRTPSSVADCLLERSARRLASAMNREYYKDAPVTVGPDDRRIVPGFYTDQMELL